MTTFELIRPWLETAGVLGLGAAGFALGRCIARLRAPWWAAGYVLPLAVIAMITAARRLPELQFDPTFAWLMHARTEFAAFGVACAALFGTLFPRLPGKRMQALVGTFMVLVIMAYSVYPFLLPAALRGQLRRLRTTIGEGGVCRQSLAYTCGPAAAVTALRKLGIPAREGELAILSYTNPMSGTEPDLLAAALRRRYPKTGIRFEYRSFTSVAELRRAGLVLALVRMSLLSDHYVAVLEVTDDQVKVGDPNAGLRWLSHDEFERSWKRCGVVVIPPDRPGPTGAAAHHGRAGRQSPTAAVLSSNRRAVSANPS